MRAQFSIEFLISLGIILAIVAFLFLFLMPLASNAGNQQMQMYSICTAISDGLNSVVSSQGNFSDYSLNLLSNQFTYYPYNISVSNGVIILTYQQNVVSCAADTLSSKSEFFNYSNLNLYRNGTTVGVAYLYGDNNLMRPAMVYGGGFLTTVSLYLTYPNGTSVLLNNSLPSQFSYHLNEALSQSGLYYLNAMDNNYHEIDVEFPFTFQS